MKKIIVLLMSGVLGLSMSVMAQDNLSGTNNPTLQELLIQLNSDQKTIENTGLVDALKPTKPTLNTSTTIDMLNKSQSGYQLIQATSCEQLKSVFVQRSKDMPQYPIMYGMEEDMIVSDSSDAMMEQKISSPTANSTTDGGMDMGISQTNTQVSGIDEPDIVKQDTKGLYFYNSEKNQVEIYAHRTWVGGGIVSSTIKIPDGMYNVQLMLHDKQLIIIGTYYEQQGSRQTSIIDSSTVTVLAIYDINNLNKPILNKHYKAPGYYQDLRLKGSQLTVVSNLGLNLYGLQEDTSIVDAAKMMPYWGYNPTPTTLKNDESLTNTTLDCTDVWYPRGSGSNDMSMTSIMTLDLNDTTTTAKSMLIAGNTQTVYMSKDRLYLIGSQWINDSASSCPITANCIWNPGTSYTQVTSLNPVNPSKPTVSRVIGYPLGQYAYHQDEAGRFHLVSQGSEVNNGESVTHVRSLDKSGKVSGALLNLEPGEQFKSSRYIGDKLYLVTFEQIDPLFVIDLSTTNPTVLGELKIPGYSTYLHPYGDMNGKTYLLGLGYDIDTSNGRTVNSGVKLDLYEIDYTKQTNGNISIKQVQSQRIGGPGTESEALTNPRMFVYDEVSKTVYLPLVRNDQRLIKFCPTGISYKPQQCYDSYTNDLLFAGYKGITVTPTSIKQTKIVNYQYYYEGIAENKGYGNDAYYLNGLNNRVGYTNGKLWFINNWFMRTTAK